MTTAAVPTLQIDNDRVRVIEWRFVVPMTTGKLHLRDAQGERFADLVAGVSYTRKAGIEHDVSNPNPTEFVFVEIETK
jgi:hypothetical protein